jgi:hypothetical protein
MTWQSSIARNVITYQVLGLMETRAFCSAFVGVYVPARGTGGYIDLSIFILYERGTALN